MRLTPNRVLGKDRTGGGSSILHLGPELVRRPRRPVHNVARELESRNRRVGERGTVLLHSMVADRHCVDLDNVGADACCVSVWPAARDDSGLGCFGILLELHTRPHCVEKFLRHAPFPCLHALFLGLHACAVVKKLQTKIKDA